MKRLLEKLLTIDITTAPGEGSVYRSVIKYAVSTLFVLCAFAIKLAIPTEIIHEIPFLIFFSAVVISGIYGGFAVGLYASFLSAALADFYFLPPTFTFYKADWHQNFKIFLYMLDCITISALCGRLKDLLFQTTLLERSEKEARLISEVEKRNAELANEAKSSFLANMSHEIRTPLAAIMGFTELLKEPALDPQEREKFLETIFRNGKALSVIIDDILDLAKVESGMIAIENIEFDLRTLLQEVSDLFRERTESKKINLQLNIGASTPTTLISDPTRLRQILINLVGNAVKFTEKGGVSIGVRIVSQGDLPAKIVISVVDSGVGITPEQQHKLFQPFVQADNSTTRRFGGTGLGLAVSKRLANALGGDISIEASHPTIGSTFVFTFLAKLGSESKPASPLPVAESKPAQINAGLTAAGSLLNGIKVLVADDSGENQYLVKRALAKYGCKIDLAGNGQEAVTMAMQENFDIILMDIQMPIMDGFEATKKLRSLGYMKPIVALTAHAMSEQRAQTLAAGCNAHLTKPLDLKEMVETIARLTSASSDTRA